MTKYFLKKNVNYINIIIPYLIIPLLIWLTYFFLSHNFGLYEDDYHRIPPIMWMKKNELWNLFITTIFVQGRPFHDGLIFVFSLIGLKINGLQGIYFISYLIVTINCILFYFFLKKILNNDIFIITGTLAFCLYPADTTRTFLTHSLGLQTSLTFFLIASHFYLSHRKNLSYLIIILCLFCYETFFLLFLPIPFLQTDKKHNLTKEFIFHSIILSSQIILVTIVRKLTGESRVSEMNLETTIIMIVKQVIIGPMISISMYLYRSFQAFSTLTIQSLLMCLFCFVIIFLLIFYSSKFKQIDRKLSENILIDLEKKVFFNHLTKLFFVAIGMLLLAYPLTFTVNAMDINGRNSRVHSAAIVGASILIACLCTLIFYVAKNYLFKNLAIAIIVCIFSLLIIFGINVQLDYQKSWAYQRQFWTDVVNLCPDLEENTVILVEGVFPSVTQINPIDWTISTILPNMYEFPSEWEFVPKLYQLEPEWRSKIWDNRKLALNNENRAISFYYFWEKERLINSSDVILLKIDQNKLERINTPITIKKENVYFKYNKLMKKNEFNTRPLYDYLVFNGKK